MYMARATTHERIDWAGQGLALDLADTLVIVRDDETVDHLSQPEQLERWLDLEKDWLGPIAEGDRPSLAKIRELRDAVRALLAAAASNEAAPQTAADVLNRYSAGARWYRQLDLANPAQPRLAYASEAGTREDSVLATIADATIELLAGPDRARVRVCPAPSCGMYFLEARRGQQWCSVPCGNRARVARHYKKATTNQR